MVLSCRILAILIVSCFLSHRARADWKADTSCNRKFVLYATVRAGLMECVVYITEIRAAMNSAFHKSRAVVAQQKNAYFLKAGGYIMRQSTIPNAACSFSHLSLRLKTFFSCSIQ